MADWAGAVEGMNDPHGYKAWFARELEGEFLLPLQLLQESLCNDILPVFANLSGSVHDFV